MPPKAKLSMRERYRLLTRDLDWEPTYVDPKDVYRYTGTRASRSTTGTRGRTRSG